MASANTILDELAVDPAVLGRANLAAVLGTLVNTRPHDLRTAFSSAAASAEADAPLAKLYTLLALAFEPVLRPQQVQEPFAPLMTFEGGGRTLVPADFAAAHLEVLEAALDAGLPPVFNARLADILWTCRHTGGGGPAKHAAMAVEAHLADARVKQKSEDWVCAPKSLERALRLSYLVDRRGENTHRSSRQATAELAAAFEAAQQWRGFLDANRLMHEFGIGEPATNAGACERVADAAAATGGELLAEGLWDQAVAFWRRAKDDARAEQAVMRTVDLAVRQSEAREADSASVAAHFLEVAIKRLRTMPAKRRGDRENELRARLTAQQARIEAELAVMSTSFDGRETWERAEAAVAGKPLADALAAYVARLRPQPVSDLRKQVCEDAERFVFMHLAPTVIIAADGKTVRQVPSMGSSDPAEREAAVRYHMVRHANFHQHLCGSTYVEAGRRAIAAEHAVAARDLLPFLARSSFVPPGREHQWVKAFAAGFDDDFTTSAHLLVPQLEHALRMLLRSAGHTAVSIDRFMQQEDWNLNQMLLNEGRTDTVAILGEDIVFDLAALLVDRSGANLRNAVSHGHLDDGALEGGLVRYLFWICLHLCIWPLIMHAVEARRRRNQEAAEPDAPSA
jgi:hypothetical protein